MATQFLLVGDRAGGGRADFNQRLFHFHDDHADHLGGVLRPVEQVGWVRFCEVFGRNPLFVFVLSGFLPRVLALCRWPEASNVEGVAVWTSPLPWLYRHVFADVGSDPRLGSFLFAVANLAFYAALAFWLDRRRIYIRV